MTIIEILALLTLVIAIMTLCLSCFIAGYKLGKSENTKK